MSDQLKKPLFGHCLKVAKLLSSEGESAAKAYLAEKGLSWPEAGMLDKAKAQISGLGVTSEIQGQEGGALAAPAGEPEMAPPSTPAPAVTTVDTATTQTFVVDAEKSTAVEPVPNLMEVINAPAFEVHAVIDAGISVAIAQAAQAFHRLYNRLEQNAAHSVLNWEEVSDLDAILSPFLPPQKPDEPVPEPGHPALPEGQRWAMIVGEPLNRTQKFIRFVDDDHMAPHKLLFVKYSMARMVGRKVKVKVNPDESQGGYVIA